MISCFYFILFSFEYFRINSFPTQIITPNTPVMVVSQYMQEYHHLHKEYDHLYDLDRVSFKDVRPDLKDAVMLYRTMNYFYNIWIDLNRLETSITSIGGLDD